MLRYDKAIHILRYGTNAEQKYIENMPNSYDLLEVNGNMMAHTSSAISNFILMNLLKQPNKAFFIDPITYAFQLSLSMIKSEKSKNGQSTIKKSIEKLINIYGEPIKSKILDNDKLVVPEDFKDHDINIAYCNNVIRFQLDTVMNNTVKKGLTEYLNASEESLVNLRPEFVIPPYFYLTLSNIDDWLGLNIEFIKIADESFANEKIYAELVISKDILINQKALKKICDKYNDLNISGILLWIDDFNAHDVSIDYLFAYTRLIKCLSKENRRIFNLYGGFFSIMLTGFSNELGVSLDGAGHGLEYGESRAVAPVGGGIPTSKYYYYPLHDRLDYKTSVELLKSLGILGGDPKKGYELYKKHICKCPVCKAELSDDINKFEVFENKLFYTVNLNGFTQRRPYASQETKELCILHYLFSKVKEFNEVRKKTFSEFIDNLKDIYLQYRDIGKISREELSYLKNWIEVFEELYSINTRQNNLI